MTISKKNTGVPVLFLMGDSFLFRFAATAHGIRASVAFIKIEKRNKASNKNMDLYKFKKWKPVSFSE